MRDDDLRELERETVTERAAPNKQLQPDRKSNSAANFQRRPQEP